MGLNYSLRAIFDRQETNRLLECLIPFLDEKSAKRLIGLQWKPIQIESAELLIGEKSNLYRGISGIQPSEKNSFEYDFCLLVDLRAEDSSMIGHSLPVEKGRSVFGTMWTEVSAGDKYVLLEMTACASTLSQLLKKSRMIHSMWREYAESSGALTAFIDCEAEEPVILFPRGASFSLPDFETLLYRDIHKISIDHYAHFILSQICMEPQTYNSINRREEDE